jgi:hypothetical protein
MLRQGLQNIQDYIYGEAWAGWLMNWTAGLKGYSPERNILTSLLMMDSNLRPISKDLH